MTYLDIVGSITITLVGVLVLLAIAWLVFILIEEWRDR